MAVSVNRKREVRKPDVELTSPHGAQITVTAERAEALLARSAIAFGDGTFRKYVEGDADPEVPVEQSAASAPRTGDRKSTS